MADLRVGEAYYVDASDCCVAAKFHARLLEVKYGGEYTRWDNGVRLMGGKHAMRYYAAKPEFFDEEPLA